MRFRNKSPFLAAAKACVRRAGEKLGLVKPEPTDYEHKPKFGHRKPSRKERIATAKARVVAYNKRVTLNRMIWIRCVKQGLQFKLFLEACQVGKHGDWKKDGRMAKRA